MVNNGRTVPSFPRRFRLEVAALGFGPRDRIPRNSKVGPVPVTMPRREMAAEAQALSAWGEDRVAPPGPQVRFWAAGLRFLPDILLPVRLTCPF